MRILPLLYLYTEWKNMGKYEKTFLIGTYIYTNRDILYNITKNIVKIVV